MYPLNVLRNTIALLELENYQLGRFWRQATDWSRRHHVGQRQAIVMTRKLWSIMTLAYLLDIAAAFGLSRLVHPESWSIVILLVLFIINAELFFIYLTISTIIFLPLDVFLKRRIIGAAMKKLQAHPQLKVVGITGSYGKTTMKELLAAILGAKYRVLKTPENINTPLGIARLIQTSLTDETDVFIVEMGAYRRGDIAALCRLTPPDIAVLTGINASHLERFGTIDATVATKFEIFDQAKTDAVLMFNADDAIVAKNAPAHEQGRQTIRYGREFAGEATVKNTHITNDGAGQTFELWRQNERLGEFPIALLGGYAPGMAAGVVILAHRLGLTMDEIKQGLATVRPVVHRLQPMPGANGVLVIDDSYNGNPDGVREAIAVLARYHDRRKVFITPGLVEMGSARQAVHETIGGELAPVADLVLLIRNSVTPFIAAGLAAAGFPEGKILWYDSAPAAHTALPQVLQPRDVVLFQNDWPDNYA